MTTDRGGTLHDRSTETSVYTTNLPMNSVIKAIALVLLCAPALATTIALIRTPSEIFVAADSAVMGEREAKFCKIVQTENTFFAVEGVAEIDVRTNGKPDPAKTFHVKPFAERAAKRSGTIAEKALGFEHEILPIFQKVVAQNKKGAPAGYKRYLSGRPEALQVIFFGMDPGNVPAYALLTLGVKDNAIGDPTITVAKSFCPGKGCNTPNDLQILGEGKKAFELSKRQSFSDYAVEVRNLVDAEIQDKPELVKPPIDVLELSVLGPNWVAVKSQCVARVPHAHR